MCRAGATAARSAPLPLHRKAGRADPALGAVSNRRCLDHPPRPQVPTDGFTFTRSWYAYKLPFLRRQRRQTAGRSQTRSTKVSQHVARGIGWKGEARASSTRTVGLGVLRSWRLAANDNRWVQSTRCVGTASASKAPGGGCGEQGETATLAAHRAWARPPPLGLYMCGGGKGQPPCGTCRPGGGGRRKAYKGAVEDLGVYMQQGAPTQAPPC